MKSKTMEDINHLIKLMKNGSPDSLNIAEAVLKNNQSIDIPQLLALRQAVFRSLSDKKNSQLYDRVEEIKEQIVENLTQKLISENPELKS